MRFENDDLVWKRRLEKAAAEQANAAKSRFLAAGSHDLRQPVHALSLFVAALRPRTMDEEARGSLDHIDTSVQAMGGLSGGLLDISLLKLRSHFAANPREMQLATVEHTDSRFRVIPQFEDASCKPS